MPYAVEVAVGIGVGVGDGVGDNVGAAGAVGAGGFGFIGAKYDGPEPPLQAEKNSVIVAMPTASMPRRNIERLIEVNPRNVE